MLYAHSASLCGTWSLPFGCLQPSNILTKTLFWSTQSSGSALSLFSMPLHVTRTIAFFSALEPYFLLLASKWLTVSLQFITSSHMLWTLSSVCHFEGLLSPLCILCWHLTFQIRYTVFVIRILYSLVAPLSMLPFAFLICTNAASSATPYNGLIYGRPFPFHNTHASLYRVSWLLIEQSISICSIVSVTLQWGHSPCIAYWGPRCFQKELILKMFCITFQRKLLAGLEMSLWHIDFHILSSRGSTPFISLIVATTLAIVIHAVECSVISVLSWINL